MAKKTKQSVKQKPQFLALDDNDSSSQSSSEDFAEDSSSSSIDGPETSGEAVSDFFSYHKAPLSIRGDQDF